MPPKSTQEYPLRFAPESDLTHGTYKLLELPPDLCKIIEGRLETRFTIRGRTTDDAVLCTAEKTYALRAVTLSNTIVIATAPEDEKSDSGMDLDAGGDTDAASGARGPELIVRDEVSQILELVPSVPKLQRLEMLLKGCEYDEGHERDDDVEDDGNMSAEEDKEKDTRNMDGDEERPRKRARFTKDSIRGEVQASDAELSQGLRDFHILEIDGYLRPLTPTYLTHILETLLNALISQHLPLPPHAVPTNTLSHHLDIEHEIPRRVTEQVLPWFGDVTASGEWKMHQKRVVTQVGLGRLMAHGKDDSVKISNFVDGWRAAVGDSFASSVELDLLEGNYLLTPAPVPTPTPTPSVPTHLSYFPASALPATPTLLFADLFLMRPRWREQDIAPFLRTVAVDSKERDKLLMKYARSTTDADGGVWYTARATHV
ncbi:hypothetical protein K439DRAFT_1336458 [Ramaria rubella]|nr:hypothetical protein K439DRAFT_1336458 [Ramaria rubella]